MYMLVLVRLPSLHDDYACMVSGNDGALRGNCRQTYYKTSFPPAWGFLLCRNLFKGSGVLSCGIFGLVGPDILGLNPWESRLSCSMSVVHSW